MSLLYTPDLVTLDYVRTHRGLTVSETSSNALLTNTIHECSAEFAEAIGRVPMPYNATRTADWCDPYLVELPDDLLALTAFTNGDDSTITGSSFALRPSNEYPKRELVLKTNTGTRLTWADGGALEAFSIDGVWGYVPHYPTCWQDTAVDVPVGGMTASSTTLTLVSTAAFEVLGYYRVGSEVIQVTVKTDTMLTHTRGELGTTAVSHLEAEGIYRFRQQSDIMGAVMAMVAHRYLNKDKIGTQVSVYDGGTVVVESLDPQVGRAIQKHWRNPGVGAP